MQDAGYTQASLGRAMGLTRSAINLLLKGQSKGMHPANLITACRLLNIRSEWLVLGEEPRRPLLHHTDLEFLQVYQRLSTTPQQTIADLVRDLAARYR